MRKVLLALTLSLSLAGCAGLQAVLGVKITGSYEANSETEFALKLFQVRHQLTPDGRAGPQFWKAIS